MRCKKIDHDILMIELDSLGDDVNIPFSCIDIFTLIVINPLTYTARIG